MDPLHIVIFSKDRACQLHSLLESMCDHFRGLKYSLSIVYRASEEAFTEGYHQLISHSPLADMRWIEEKDFREDLLHIINELPSESFVMFLVDDDIVFRPLLHNDVMRAFSHKHLFISLRCSRDYVKYLQPSFLSIDPVLEWKWNYGRKKSLSWNYPFSVDGNIFHTKHIQKIIRTLDFKAPNSLEGRLHHYRHTWWVKWVRGALAPQHAVIVNNPLNKVQTEGETWHNNGDIASLNQMYCKGYRIDNQPLYRALPDDTHFAMDITFKKEEN
jgi:hypothetical protein